MKIAGLTGLVFGSFFILAPNALAQNTAAVFGPVVNADANDIEYRAALSPDGEGRDLFVHRLHYQKAINDDLRWRVVLQGSDLENGDLEFNFVQAELQWQVRDKADHGWDSAVRLDVRINEGDDTPSLVGLNWTSQKELTERWRLNTVLLSGLEVGQDRTDGVFLQSRVQTSYALTDRLRFGGEVFNFYGSTADFAPLGLQNHAAGPFLSGKLTKDIGFFVGALFGFTEGARSQDYRVFVSKAF